jgi:hypothetical protein
MNVLKKGEFASGLLPQDALEFWRNSILSQLKVWDKSLG